ncbi:MAG TPA: hypothetical protein VFY25_07695, partial [Anaerolineales bacterium]|nr:hypothetical protein [Anaerolineales bacterium]
GTLRRLCAITLFSYQLYPEVIIIGFGSHLYAYEKGREGVVPAAAFSPRKAYLTFYVDNKFEGAEELYAKPGKYKKSVACLYGGNHSGGF